MLNLNKNKLIPAIEISTSWGERKGDISKQTDLVELTTDLDTSIKGWVTEQGFLTESQDLSEFATKTDLKDYVKIKSLNNTLDGYVKKNSVYTQNESDSKFLSKIDASNIYLTQTSADVKFA